MLERNEVCANADVAYRQDLDAEQGQMASFREILDELNGMLGGSGNGNWREALALCGNDLPRAVMISEDRAEILRSNVDNATEDETNGARREISSFIGPCGDVRERRLIEGLAHGLLEGDLEQVASLVAALSDNPEALRRYADALNDVFRRARVDITLKISDSGKLQIKEKGDSRFVEVDPSTGEVFAYKHVASGAHVRMVENIGDPSVLLKEIGNQIVGDLLGNDVAAGLPEIPNAPPLGPSDGIYPPSGAGEPTPSPLPSDIIEPPSVGDKPPGDWRWPPIETPEATALLKVFDRLDADQDGFLTAKEILEGIQSGKIDAASQRTLMEILKNYGAVSDASDDEHGPEVRGVSKRDISSYFNSFKGLLDGKVIPGDKLPRWRVLPEFPGWGEPKGGGIQLGGGKLDRQGSTFEKVLPDMQLFGE